LDVWYLNGWVALYQFIFGLLSFPVVFIPLPAPATYVSPRDFGLYFVRGIKCFFGINSQLTIATPDRCDYFWLIFMIFIIFNMTYNILILVVFQRGSSTLAVVASAARLALSNVGFLIKPLAGEAYQNKLTLFDIIALIVLIMGIVLYSLKQERTALPTDPLRKVLDTTTSKLSRVFCFCCHREEEDELYVPDDSVNTVQKYYRTTDKARIDTMYQ
jgi:hypothetical protein